MTEPLLRVLSLGAGVQSSTLYLMACAGEFGEESPTVAIFADTQWEPPAVYEWLEWDPRKAQLDLFENECEGICGV